MKEQIDALKNQNALKRSGIENIEQDIANVEPKIQPLAEELKTKTAEHEEMKKKHEKNRRHR